ncbi:MAG: undecaprenyl-diphosphate phosphatase [Elusimicrobia bacterium]|nr:undecaprenyl-diphosphate phosphatase [Elusimicrobiota bacterium]
MGHLQAAVLGVVQGLTEFLPVSSSAHLILVPKLLGWPDQGLAADVALHWGTMTALVIYFWKDWWAILTDRGSRRMLLWLALASVPAAVLGLLVKDFVEQTLRGVLPVAVTLVSFGLLMGWADRIGLRSRGWDSLDLKTCLWIGAAQALALFPGVSRSGITITAGLLLGLKREDAARFSFVLAVPVVFGAGVLEFKHLGEIGLTPAFWIAVAASCLTGLAVIAGFLRYLKNGSLLAFAGYRVALGAVLLLLRP